jgi:tetratricopeptide (TPR) repeat protein
MKVIVIVFLLISSLSFAQTAKEYFLQGKIHYNNARYEKAIEQFNMAIRLDSADANYFLQRGFCKGLIGDYEGSIDDFTKAYQLDPVNKYALVSRGSAKNKLGRFEEAIEDFNLALQIDPDYAEIYNNRGFAYKALGNQKAACQDWNTSRKKGNEEAVIILKNNRCK